MSGINQPIRYCTNRSATMSQWNTFAVVPYCKRSVMRFLKALAGLFERVRPKAGVIGKALRRSSGLGEPRGGVRHRIDRSGGVGAVAGAGITPRNWKRVPHDGLDDPAVGGRRQSVTHAEVDAKVAELEIRHGEQRVLLIGRLCEVPDLAEVGIIFEPYEEIRPQPACNARRGRKIRLAVFAETDVHDRVDDEFVVRVTDTDDGPYLHGKSGLREFRRGVAELEIDAIEKVG